MYLFFYRHFDYCCEIWGNTYKTSLQCLFILQKRVIRTVTHSDYLANTNEIFVKLCVLKLKDIIAYKSYLLAFKAFNNMLPLILNSLFVVKSGPYSMRHTNNFVGTICKSNMRSLNVIMVALNNWNKLPNQVKLIFTKFSLKLCY